MAFIKYVAAKFATAVIIVATIWLCIAAFNFNWYWFVLLIPWLPVSIWLCAKLGHENESSDTNDHSEEVLNSHHD